jgi:hypothetical protein
VATNRRLFPHGLPIMLEATDDPPGYVASVQDADVTAYGWGESEEVAIGDLLRDFGDRYRDFLAYGDDRLGLGLQREVRRMHHYVLEPGGAD